MMRADAAPRLLLIEDDRAIRRYLRMALEAADLKLAEAETLQQARAELKLSWPDLVLLDLGLPDGDGVDFVRELRRYSGVPVLVLSARMHEQEKVAALDAGADDFLSKPFGNAELVARVRALLRRSGSPSHEERFLFGDIEVDPLAMSVTRHGKPVHLTPTEMQLLLALLRSRGRVLTHAVLLREVWGHHGAEQGQYLRVYVGHLRRKLEADPARPQWLLTEPGVGYRFAWPT